MKTKQRLKQLEELIKPYRITDGKNFRMKDMDPGDTADLDASHKDQAKELLQEGIELLSELQDKLYAQDRWALLIVFQAMDAAGKDSTIKHVMSGVNPQGCQVTSFKQPSAEELDHDFMWRYSKRFPNRGDIGIFNRSYYEEVLVVRVHENLLLNEKMPPEVIGKKIWDERLTDIRNCEDYLYRNGVVPVKFFLNVSRKEQKARFIARLDKPDKNWKFSSADLHEREYWNDYMHAYEEAIRATATKTCPWYVVPADNKWFTRLVVGAAIVSTLENLDLDYPALTKEQKAQLDVARKALSNGKASV
jgi:PPK2 family polyphosphate:nucleotide phosphotransferase